MKRKTFVLDTKMNEGAIEISKNSNLLICEATYSKEDKELAEERSHLISTESATIAKKAKVKRLILTHLSQRYEEIPKVIVKEAKEVFENVTVAEDFDIVEI